MAKGRGTFIKLDRGIRDNWVWQSKPYSPGQAWLDLLMEAAYATTVREWKGSFLTQHRGEVFTSITSLSERWGWSYKKVVRFIRALEGDGMVRRGDLPKGTLLTIENYEKFQGRGRACDRAEGRANDRADDRATSDNKRKYKEDKKKSETQALEGDSEAVASAQREEDEELARLLGYESVEELEKRRA